MNDRKYLFNFERVEIDPYKLPPLMIIATCPIFWTLSQATSKKHRRYLAHSIILGQPFIGKIKYE